MDRRADPLTLPAAAPALVAASVSALPGRLRRRLEAEARLADAWRWTRKGGRLVVGAGPEAA